MTRILIAPALSFILILTTIQIHAQDSLLVEHFKKNAKELRINGQSMSGDGFDFLMDISKSHDFFLIGEDHGMQEPPLFASALFKAFQSSGYQYFATETGPWTAQFLEQKAKSQDIDIALQNHFDKFSWSIPFYSWKEETNIIKAVCRQEGEGPFLWGLDQEFAVSFRMFFEILAENASNKTSKAVAEKYLKLANDGMETSVTQKNPGLSFMGSAKPENFSELKAAFAGQQKNLELIDGLETSIHIYQLWFVGEGYQSNVDRAALMKEYFNQYYAAAKKKGPVKLMGKFGANHIYKGLNGLNIPDIGNHISEIAAMEGEKSFHLYVMGKKGTQNAYNPFSQDEADKIKTYDPQNAIEQINVMPILMASSNESSTIIDCRPIRKLLFDRKIKNIDTGLTKLINSYDAILIFNEVHAATNF